MQACEQPKDRPISQWTGREIADEVMRRGLIQQISPLRKLLKRGSFTCVEDLQAKVFAFIDYYNRTMAKPFKWTYQGKALTV
jgi:hypothetical protein